MRHVLQMGERSRKHRVSMLAFLWIMLVVASMILCPFDAHAITYNGIHKNLNRSNVSDLVIIGDSRIELMAELNNAKTKKASYNATVGGHHISLDSWGTGTWKNRPMVISWNKGTASTTNYLQQQKNLVKACLQKQKSCKVVIVGTINDVGFKNGATASVNRMKWVRSQLQSVKVNGKSAKVYFASIIPERNKISAVSSYNAAIKKAAAGKYIDLGTTTWKSYYAPDGCHLQPLGSLKLFDAIKAKAK